jgi:hypothetical protein
MCCVRMRLFKFGTLAVPTGLLPLFNTFIVRLIGLYLVALFSEMRTAKRKAVNAVALPRPVRQDSQTPPSGGMKHFVSLLVHILERITPIGILALYVGFWNLFWTCCTSPRIALRPLLPG